MRSAKVLTGTLLAALLLSWRPACAEETPSDNLSNYLHLLRSEISSIKVQAVNDGLNLSESEAEVFWPIYREYDSELAKLSDVKVALIKEFISLQNAGMLDAAKADDMARRWLAYQEDRLALWKTYHARLDQALGAVRAAQFLQLEHQLALFIDLAIASEMPAVGAPPAGGATDAPATGAGVLEGKSQNP